MQRDINGLSTDYRIGAIFCLFFLSFVLGCGGGAAGGNMDQWSAEIISPVNLNTYYLNDPITFQVSESYENPSQSNDDYIWTSSKDGEIGRGRSITTDTLSEGVHNIVLTIMAGVATAPTVEKVIISIAADRAVKKTIFVGHGPAYLSITPDGSYVYVPNFDDDSVSVIRTADNEVVDTIDVGGDPVAIEISADGAYAYVTNSMDSTVSVIRTLDNHVVTTVSVDRVPWGLAVAPNGEHVYTANQRGPNVSLIDSSNNYAVTNIANHPEHNPPDSLDIRYYDTAASKDSNYLYVTALTSMYIQPGDPLPHGNGEILVIQTSDYAIADRIPIGDLSVCLALSPSGNHLYVTNAVDNTVTVIQTSDNSIVDMINVGSVPDDITFASNGEFFYVTNNEDNSLSMVRASDNAVIDTFYTGDTPWGVAVALNEHFVYVSNFGEQTVYYIEVSD